MKKWGKKFLKDKKVCKTRKSKGRKFQSEWEGQNSASGQQKRTNRDKSVPNAVQSGKIRKKITKSASCNVFLSLQRWNERSSGLVSVKWMCNTNRAIQCARVAFGTTLHTTRHTSVGYTTILWHSVECWLLQWSLHWETRTKSKNYETIFFLNFLDEFFVEETIEALK